MDTSKEYIKMCDCPEIQSHMGRRWPHPLLKDKQMGNLKEGDLYYNGFRVNPYDCRDLLDQKTHVWLPRQDQLQEMVRPEIIECYGPDISDLHGMFTEWLRCADPDFKTYEQLWLGYVMAELHNKQWNWGKWE